MSKAVLNLQFSTGVSLNILPSPVCNQCSLILYCWHICRRRSSFGGTRPYSILLITSRLTPNLSPNSRWERLSDSRMALILLINIVPPSVYYKYIIQYWQMAVNTWNGNKVLTTPDIFCIIEYITLFRKGRM